MSKILVIGSSNTDLIAKVKNFPTAGETIEGIAYMQAMGGKGANQAVAAHRLGGEVRFITCLGDDANGQNALQYYKKEGLDISSSLIVEGVSSGTAMIWVDEKGENCIVITPGANNKLTPEYILKIEENIANAGIVVLQMEIP
jgi:ribokinase